MPRSDRGSEFLFTLGGADRAELTHGLVLLRQRAVSLQGSDIAFLAQECHMRDENTQLKPLAIAMVARSRDELTALIDQGGRILANSTNEGDSLDHPSLRDRLFFSPRPLGREGKIAFVFPGSGNHFPGMGAELSGRWPETFRCRDAENLYLSSQFQPGLIWNGAQFAAINDDPQAIIFAQVATGCALSDIVRHFGVKPQAVIGYSLGESAGYFALGAWRDRDGMLGRMRRSTLFTQDLAGEHRAAARAWGLGPEEKVEWRIGVVEAPASEVRRLLSSMARVYLLIVNTPDECVIGGDAQGVERLVALLGCRFFPIHGVTAAHCEVARQVALPYRDLHLFEATPPPGMAFYSGAWGRAYDLDKESAADSMLAQAVDGIDFPRVVKAAYGDGVRLFLEMGPGSSCSRMIDCILAGHPHMARSACFPGVDPASALLRLLGRLIAERVEVNLAPLFPSESLEVPASPQNTSHREPIRVGFGGKPFQPPLPIVANPPVPPYQGGIAEVTSPEKGRTGGVCCAEVEDSLFSSFAAAQEARIKAHDAYLRFSDQVAGSMENAIKLQLSLQEALDDGSLHDELPAEVQENSPPPLSPAPNPPVPPYQGGITMALEQSPPLIRGGREGLTVVFDREMCMEFACGSVGRMLGPAFAEADTFPTRVRLPDEPLMLVDRIVALEGEARSMSRGRVATEHDIQANAWYLDAGRIPTCIAVEAGQADLFLSGYLGIDFITRGLAVYRLLDAVVTFHRELPGPGETIHYDISIEHFFQQGETRFFRFRFDATVAGKPLLTMRDGCAGFFSAAELAAGRGIVHSRLDLRPRTGSRPDDWVELAPMATETYNAVQLDLLRAGDLAGCFGTPFAGLGLNRPLTIPGGRMRLVHRVTCLDPLGGRYGLGLIRAEADIHPDDWFLTCHFVDDRVMPGTLMYECCLHTLRIFLLRMGWVAEASGAAWEPVPGVASRLSCRGQVLETTRIVAYEVSIRELGYCPEPYAIVDALMYADNKAIVEITSMSVRLSGTTKEEIEALWRCQGPEKVCADVSQPVSTAASAKKPPAYTREQILAYSNGNPSEGFGEPYRIFDSDRVIARLPGPPYQFMDRVTAVRGEPWRMVPGAMAEAQYDIPPDAWYFAAEKQPRMPFAVLLEVALQPCGWLAAYVGSALTSAVDLSFRNLGGSALQHRPVTPESGVLTATASLKKAATSGGMIIQEYDFTVADRLGTLYEGETMFGFFSREALNNQVGIRDASPYRPTAEEVARGTTLPYPETRPFPEKELRMIDQIELFVPDGGPAGLGYIRGIKEVDPDEWFFKAHFYQDPVTPGSLGLESFLQLLEIHRRGALGVAGRGDPFLCCLAAQT